MTRWNIVALLALSVCSPLKAEAQTQSDAIALSTRRNSRPAVGARRTKKPTQTPRAKKRGARWHKRATARAIRAWKKQSPRPLVLRPVAAKEKFELTPDIISPEASSKDVRFSGQRLLLAKKAFASRRDGSMHEIHPRLLELMHRAVVKFRVPYVYVVSGYRGHAKPTSKHFQGRAVDFVLPGVSDNRLAAFLRKQGYVGVGVYPESGFVHLDVREHSFYWIDHSKPGQASREEQVRQREAWRNDRRARKRGEVQVVDLVVDEQDRLVDPATGNVVLENVSQHDEKKHKASKPKKPEDTEPPELARTEKG